MDDKQKVYIRGVKGRGDEVIDALKAVGGKINRDHVVYGDDDQRVYMINHKGFIDSWPVAIEPAKIIMDNYREIKLSEQWKNGDVLISKDGGSFDIFRCYDSDSSSFSSLLEVMENVCHECSRMLTFYAGIYRLATPSEVERFHELLHKHGKDWDAEKKRLVGWKWKPKEKEIYWCIFPDGHLSSGIFNNDEFDNNAYNFGNCFRTREEAEIAAERVKKALKGGDA